MDHILNKRLPVAVLGAEPVGLAAAAHLVARGFTPLILEAGAQVASNLESYRHIRLFSPWQYNVDKAARQLLMAAGWQAPDLEALPTAGEIVDGYLLPLAGLPVIALNLRLSHRVVAITRAGFDKVKTRGRESAPFVIRAATPEGEREYLAVLGRIQPVVTTPLIGEGFMGGPAGWMYKSTGRVAMRSPGAPSHRPETERRFWEQIATGITSEKAAACRRQQGLAGSVTRAACDFLC